MPSAVQQDPAEPIPPRDASDTAIAQAAFYVVDHMLGDGMSVIEPGTAIWTAKAAEALRNAIEDNPVEGSQATWDKLELQLAGQSRGVILLCAEIVYLRDLPNRSVTPPRKVDDVTRVLSCLSEPVPVPREMSRLLSAQKGAFVGGMGYAQGLWKQIPWFARFVTRWASLPEDQKESARRDPWVFHKIVMGDPGDQPNIRNTLLFLAFPEVFEPVISEAHKHKIRDTFADTIGGKTGDDPEAVDRDLLAIRVALFRESKQPVEWYQEPLLSRWRLSKPAKREEAKAEAVEEGVLFDPVAFTALKTTLPRATENLARELHLPILWLNEYIGLLESRRQLIVYGPPGTGKTFVARNIAHHVAGENVRIVQFHPSYAYEDFIEGLRPVAAAEGSVSYEVMPGPLRRIAQAAQNDLGHPYVLIVDEINRADIAKVFGELYYLLEYRGEEINLQYSPDTKFFLPGNLYLIGTMNTADRSIALVDAAIRRRFPFIEMHPSEWPVSEVLANYLESVGATGERAELLTELNGQLTGRLREFQIGPSYLMREEAVTDSGLKRIWDYDILPLLEEQLYGTYDREQVRTNFGLETIRRAAAAKKNRSEQETPTGNQPET